MRIPSLARRAEHGKTPLLLVLVLTGLAAPIFLAAPPASHEGSAGPTPAVQSVPQDTAFLFGPRRFDGMAGGTAVYAERFVVVTSFTAGYTLRSENGAPDGTGRVDSALVILNDDPILTPADYAGGDRVLTRPVTLVPEDTLVVVVYGSSGTFLNISVYTTPDPSFTVYGPRKVEIVSGSRMTVTDSFPLPAGAAPKYRLYLVNGEPDGSKRVADAVVTLNGVDVVQSREIGRTYEKVVKDVNLLSFNRLSVRIQSNVPAHVTVRFTATDSVAPVLTIDSPAEGAAVSALEVEVSGTIQDQTATRVTVNGVQAAVTNNASYAATVLLPVEGANALQVTAIDAAGNQTDSTRNVIRDTQAPVITVNEPADGFITRDTLVTVSGTIQDATEVTANLNGAPLTLDGAGGFSAQAPLVEGENFLTVSATDAAGNGASVTRLVIRDSQAPVLTVQQPLDGATTDADSITVSGTVVDATPVTVTANGVALAVVDTTFSGRIALVEGTNTITATATDAAGNSSTDVRTVTRGTGELPPDPATVASEIDPTVATTLAAATEFLYTGDDPIQTGVAAGTIEPVRAAVLRGKVLTRAGDPLSGVEITILGHPEFGSTLSRADGAFDMAVNGGGPLTVNYEKSGFLPAQRPVNARWQDYIMVADVVLIGLDPAVTTIDLATATDVQVARGTTQTDEDGARQATLLFEPGTQAELVLSDGTTQSLSALNVRLTEYTVGASGPSAMPAPLPPTSGYTYAVELSADEAISAGADQVRFTQPMPLYVENFLGFPVGLRVPVGFYDRTKAEWVPSKDGRVIEVVGTTGSLADLDVDGDGVADDSLTLSGLGITNAEREQLAALYPVGQSLWRSQIEHFSPVDKNYPVEAPSGATAPEKEPPQNEAPENDPCEGQGSIIECQNQVLGERLAIVGTPFTLNYRSDRVPGRVAGRTLKIPLSGDSVPSVLKRIELEIQVAGRTFLDTFPALPNQTFTFVWDGRDAYGRTLQGSHPVFTRIGYVYDGVYQSPPPSEPSFGASSGEPLETPARREVTISQAAYTTAAVTMWDARATGLGGWTLSAHHTYDPVGRVLYRGDGTRIRSEFLPPIINTVAGNGTFGSTGDGGPALDASFKEVAGVRFAPDGTLYIVDSEGSAVRRVGTDGIIRAFAGTGVRGNSGDEGPATEALLTYPWEITLGPDGSVYIADVSANRVRWVLPDGTITTVAGIGSRGFSGDGGPAIEARLDGPSGVAVGPDGSLYISDSRNHRIRRVSPDGIINTIAGTGTEGYSGDGGPALAAQLNWPAGLAFHPDGSLYFAAAFGNVVRRIGPDGIITTIVGDGTAGYSGDGGPATQAQLDRPNWITIGPDGSLYISDGFNAVVRRVSPEGVITTFAGTGEFDFSGDGGPARAASMCLPSGLAFSPDGALYVGDFSAFCLRVRRIDEVLEPFLNQEITIAAADGSEVYVFSSAGRHLRTLDALTGALRYTFDYDSAGRLVQVVDGDSLVTRVERDVDGRPAALIGPFGQTTSLHVDSIGYMSVFSNSAGDSLRLAHTAEGLLSSLTDARGATHLFAYDSLGRLTRTDDPVGEFKTISRSDVPDGFEVSLTTSSGRTTVYRVEQLASGGTRSVSTTAAGLSTVSTAVANGTISITLPDGTTSDITQKPGPGLGMSAPILSELSVRLPSGLTSSTRSSRRVLLADPDEPLSLTSRIDSVTINSRVYTNTYDASARRFTTVTPEGRVRSGRIDALGRLTQVVAPALDTVNHAYNSIGQLSETRWGTRIWRYGYGADGRLASVTDPLERVWSFGYDATGRVTLQRLPDGREVLYAHDPNGNLASITPPGRPAHRYEYSLLGLAEVYTPPDIGLPVTATSFSYTLDRQLHRISRPDGLVMEFAYDAGGRVAAIAGPRDTVRYSYDPVTGLPKTVETSQGDNLTMEFDGRMPIGVTWTGDVSGSVGLTYNSDFNVTAIGVNDTDTLRLSYDRDGRVIAAGDLSISRDHASGVITAATLGSVSTERFFDRFGQLSGYVARYSSTELFNVTIMRDGIGRITEITESVQGAVATFRYSYDVTDRLVEVERDGVIVSSYEYDSNGNRVRLTQGGGSELGAYDNQDRVISYGDAMYTFTPNGDLESRTVAGDSTSFLYDGFGNLRTVRMPDGKVIEYVVDGFNRRVGRKLDGVLVQGFLYQDRINPVAETDGSNGVVARFVYATKGNVPDYLIKNDSLFAVVSDHLGSVRLVVAVATGEVVQRLDYDEFGRVLVNTNPGFQPFGFAGGLLDPVTGLTRFGARDYEAATGRWTSKDPLGFGGGDPNLYTYVGNNPVSLYDPFGLCPPWVTFTPCVAPFGDGYDYRLADRQTPSRTCGSLFGRTRSGGTEDHTGIDLYAPVGTPIYAAADGVITRAGWRGDREGNGVRIEVVGPEGTAVIDYFHMESIDPAILRGGEVRVHAGQLIGTSGRTAIPGDVDPHVDFKIRWEGQFIDPIQATPALYKFLQCNCPGQGRLGPQ